MIIIVITMAIDEWSCCATCHRYIWTVNIDSPGRAWNRAWPEDGPLQLPPSRNDQAITVVGAASKWREKTFKTTKYETSTPTTRERQL